MWRAEALGAPPGYGELGPCGSREAATLDGDEDTEVSAVRGSKQQRQRSSARGASWARSCGVDRVIYHDG